ncbi:MAG: glycosyltransferase family 2 protein [Marinibacterium sp.]
MNTTTTDLPEGPGIAVIIPHYNDLIRLERCLSGLMRNNLDGAEIVVVDNASPTPPGAEMQRAFPTVRFLTETEKGAAATRNRGVAETSAPVLAFLDADCVPDPDWLDVARVAPERAPVTGGRVDVFDETPPPRSGAEAFETVFAFNTRAYVEKKGFSITANLVTTRAVFDDVGPFRAHVSEDTDWSFRARDKGYRLVYDDGLAVRHPSRADWNALRRKWARTTREGFALEQDNRSGLPARLYWGAKALAMPASVVVHLPRLLTSPKLDTTAERLRGAGTLARIRMQRMVWMLGQAAGYDIRL